MGDISRVNCEGEEMGRGYLGTKAHKQGIKPTFYNLIEVWTNQENTFVQFPTINTCMCLIVYKLHVKKLTDFNSC